MKHRFLSLALTLALLLTALCPAALASTLPWDMADLHEHAITRSLVRAYGDGYEYFTYNPSAFNTSGCMGSIQLDLDNDGVYECLAVVLEQDQTVSLNVYDQLEPDAWQRTATVTLYEAALTCNIQANDVFLKHNGYNWVIFSENWMQENGVADGAAWSFQAYAYGDNSLVRLTDLSLDGTDIAGSFKEWKNGINIDYRPELKDVAAEVDTYGFMINTLYWANPICEQDASLTVVSRMMSVQDIPYEKIYDFTSAGGSSLSGYRSLIINCAPYAYTLPQEYFLVNNRPVTDYEYDYQYTYTEDPSLSEFIILDSDVRELTVDELSAYDKETLALIRNEILARYGYPFQKQKYRDYFGSKSWYTRNESFTYSMLSSLEMENIELIKKLEAK